MFSSQLQMSCNDECKCPFCKTRHSLRHCRIFLQMNPGAKRQYVKTSEFCVNCLGMGNQIKYCTVNGSCRVCHLAHHTLLHPMDDVRSSWMKMTPKVWLRSPVWIESEVKDRVLLDPLAHDSCFYLGDPFPGGESSIPPFARVILTSARNDERCLRKNCRLRRVEPIEPLWNAIAY